MPRIGKDINFLSTKIRRAICNLPAVANLSNISGSNVFIIVYLYKNEDKDLYQKDIEHEFGMTRSTVSSIISLMEQKNLIIREAVNGDARLKKIVLTDIAKKYAMEVINDLDNFERKLSKNLSDNELDTLDKLLNKIEMNLMEE